MGSYSAFVCLRAHRLWISRALAALEADPESPQLLEELRATITAEAIMLTFVVTVTVTAWLVSATL